MSAGPGERHSCTVLTAVLKQGEECFTLDACRSHQVGYDVEPHFVVPRYDERPGAARLFQLYVAALLTGTFISDLFKDANQFVPGKRA